VHPSISIHLAHAQPSFFGKMDFYCCSLGLEQYFGLAFMAILPFLLGMQAGRQKRFICCALFSSFATKEVPNHILLFKNTQKNQHNIKEESEKCLFNSI
jgi:hypothetical protein